MSDEDKRPSWPHKIPEKEARWLNNHRVAQIFHKWQMTGVDTAEYWIVLMAENGDELIVPVGFVSAWPEVQFLPDHAGLIQFRQYNSPATTISEIEKWERKHARDLAEFRRLKAKFEGCENV